MKLSIPRLPTVRDVDINGIRVFMRIDVNVPVNPDTGEILDDRRIKVHSIFIRKLLEEYKPALVVASHQGRPGESSFTTMEKHAELLSKYTGVNVRYVPDVIGPKAIEEIKRLEQGEVLMLDNLRLLAEEIPEAPPEKQALTIMARRIASVFDVYVNDAFATAHRSQPSIVGIPLLIPGCMGPLFEKEVEAIKRVVESGESPRIYILGGSKVVELLRVIENLMRNKLADRILTTGLLAQLFLVAKGLKLGAENVKVLEEKGLLPLVSRARYILMRGAPIETPIDLKVEVNGEVRNTYIGELKGIVKDVGEHTIGVYSDLIRDAGLIVMRGPAGVIEDVRFKEGTARILDAVYSSKAFTLIAGGHLTSMIDESKTSSRIHVSTGGNALLLFLSGEELPAFKALELSARMFLGW
ncbi:MAG: phosphoglycerate kinase [Desulfurococcus sp.]|nr:phosphoglycerate kinase [Desulfurococcus sp.]